MSRVHASRLAGGCPTSCCVGSSAGSPCATGAIGPMASAAWPQGRRTGYLAPAFGIRHHAGSAAAQRWAGISAARET